MAVQEGNPAYLRQQFNKVNAAGPRHRATDFLMSIEGYPDLSVLIRTSQYPAMKRAMSEDNGPGGIAIGQYGAIENKGDCSATIVETVSGNVYSAMKDIVYNGKYVDVTLRAAHEMTGGKAGKGQTCHMLKCLIAMDPSDLAYDDPTALVKAPLTITYNWVDWE